MADTANTPTPSDVAQAAQDNQTPEDAVTTAESSSTSEVQGDTAPETGHAETTEDTTDTPQAGEPEDTVGDEPEDGSDTQDDDQADDNPAGDESDAMDAKAQWSLRKARREAANLRTRLKDAEATANRYRVAMEAGIPADAMEFLQGDSLEAMEQSAEKLLVMMGYTGRVTPPGGPVETGGNPRRGDFAKVNQANQTTDLDTIGNRIYNQN